MKYENLEILKCPRCSKNMYVTEVSEQSEEVITGSVTCEKGHSWSIRDGIIDLQYPHMRENGNDRQWIELYTQLTQSQDEKYHSLQEQFSINIMKALEGLSQFLPNKKEVRILDMCTGIGNNLIALENAVGKRLSRHELHGLDVSHQLLEETMKRFREREITANLVEGNVYNTPFRNDYFDLVLNVGCANLLSEKEKFLNEMLRVAQADAFVVVIDKGISPRLRGDTIGSTIIQNDELFAMKPPLEHLPNNAKDVEIDYIMSGFFYRLVFKK